MACTVRWASTVEKSPAPAPGTKNWLLPTKSRTSSSIAEKESAMAAKAAAEEEEEEEEEEESCGDGSSGRVR
jgi:ribosomal protein L12E/L44/L45/RPP1/RPP2